MGAQSSSAVFKYGLLSNAPEYMKINKKTHRSKSPLSPSSKYSHRCFMSLWRRDCLLMESELPNKVQRVFDGALAT